MCVQAAGRGGRRGPGVVRGAAVRRGGERGGHDGVRGGARGVVQEAPGAAVRGRHPQVGVRQDPAEAAPGRVRQERQDGRGVGGEWPLRALKFPTWTELRI